MNVRGRYKPSFQTTIEARRAGETLVRQVQRFERRQKEMAEQSALRAAAQYADRRETHPTRMETQIKAIAAAPTLSGAKRLARLASDERQHETVRLLASQILLRIGHGDNRPKGNENAPHA